MKIQTKDTVKIIAGKDKGKEGVVEKVFNDAGRIVVHGVNIAKRHIKPGKVSKEGGIISIEKSVDVSNVMVICPKCKKPARIGLKIVDGKKHRICKSCGNAL